MQKGRYLGREIENCSIGTDLNEGLDQQEVHDSKVAEHGEKLCGTDGAPLLLFKCQCIRQRLFLLVR